MSIYLPLLIEPEELAVNLDAEDLLIVDLSQPGSYKNGHIPGAIHLPYPSILYSHDEVDCDIPSDELLSEALSSVGLTEFHHVVAYDDQSCPMACRLLWTLDEIGHTRHSLLNGGWNAWRSANLPVEKIINKVIKSQYIAQRKNRVIADKTDILNKLHQPGTIVIDTRMEEELTNELIMCDRGGYIPGALHFDWMDAVDEGNDTRIVDLEMIKQKFESMGLTTDHEIIVYCQTNMRSTHTYTVLKLLGYHNIKSYAAGYAEWGNNPDTPIENEFVNETILEPDENTDELLANDERKPELQLIVNTEKLKQETYKVANIDLAEFGRQTIKIFEDSMPGLMAIRRSYEQRKPFSGLRITGSYRIDPMLAVFIETLSVLGADIRWTSQDVISTQDNVAAALAAVGINIFAWYNQTEIEFQWCIEQALWFDHHAMPHILIDEGDEGRLLTMHHFNENRVKPEHFLQTDEKLNEIKFLLDDDARELLMAVIQLAKWERTALKPDEQNKNNMKLWVADPMVCHCDSVVMLKSTLCACA